MIMRFNYILTISDAETDKIIGHIEAQTEESLLEQIRKMDVSIAKYKEDKEFMDSLDDEPKCSECEGELKSYAVGDESQYQCKDCGLVQ
jgi:tRNA(Ile2) C34 agmatinyltransferase TiaS